MFYSFCQKGNDEYVKWAASVPDVVSVGNNEQHSLDNTFWHRNSTADWVGMSKFEVRSQSAVYTW